MSCGKDHCAIGDISCAVSGCIYNSPEHKCCADHIKVENDMAETKIETYCGTFKAK